MIKRYDLTNENRNLELLKVVFCLFVCLLRFSLLVSLDLVFWLRQRLAPLAQTGPEKVKDSCISDLAFTSCVLEI